MKYLWCIILYWWFNLWILKWHIVCPCDMGLTKSLMGMMEESLKSERPLHIITFTAILYVDQRNLRLCFLDYTHEALTILYIKSLTILMVITEVYTKYTTLFWDKMKRKKDWVESTVTCAGKHTDLQSHQSEQSILQGTLSSSERELSLQALQWLNWAQTESSYLSTWTGM